MNKIDIALLLICLYDSYALRKKSKKIAELENELIDLKMRAMLYKPEENTDQYFEDIEIE